MRGTAFSASRVPMMLGALLLFLFCGAAPLALAQSSGSSTIRGIVSDSQQKLVAGATVTLFNTATNASRTQTTNESGQYIFTAVLPGTYKLTVEASGFKKTEVDNVRALVDNTTEYNVELTVGGGSEVVQVTATSVDAIINTQDGSLGNNFVTQQITQLPLESRNVANLLSLQPAVTPGGAVAGSRSDQANITLDGVDVNDQVGGFAFSPILRVTADSVSEFRVTTVNPNASQGRSAGAQVSLITKSGTNDFHGSLYEFHRNTVTSANDYFNNRAGIARPQLLRNTFGGAIGGPIVKDRLFFFFNYEGFREAKQTSLLRTVPLASLGRGELNVRVAGGGIRTISGDQFRQIFNRAGINPVTLQILADAARRYPANDITAAGDGLNTGGFRFNSPLPVRNNTSILRLDWNVDRENKHIVFFRGNYQYDNAADPAGPQFPGTPIPNQWVHPYGGVVGHTWTISNNKINNFRYGLTRDSFTLGGDSAQNSVNFRDVYQPFAYTRTLARTTPVQNITDDFTWIKGDHTLQFGANIRLIEVRADRLNQSFDDFAFNFSWYQGGGGSLLTPLTAAGITVDGGFQRSAQSAITALIGRIPQVNARNIFGRDGNPLPVGSPVSRKLKTQEYDFYAQDVWKFRPNLTITYGLRYGISRPVYEANGLQARPNVNLGEYFEARKAAAAQGRALNDPISIELAGPANNRPGNYDFDLNNFQPRVSVAWSPNPKDGSLMKKIFGGNGDSVIRGGFAMINDYYGIQIANQFDTNNTLGFASTFTSPVNAFNVTDRLAPLFTGFGQSTRDLRRADGSLLVPAVAPIRFPRTQPADQSRRIESSLDSSVRTPYQYTMNLSYGRKLPAGIFAEVSYIGRIARNLLATRDVMALNNLVDTRSGMDWYTAAGMLTDFRNRNLQVGNVPTVAWFENVLPRDFGNRLADLLGDRSYRGLGPTQAMYLAIARRAQGGNNEIFGSDWTTLQDFMDAALDSPIFFQPQYGTLSAWGSFATSDYHGMTVSVRQRFREQVIWDFNYTLAKSFDLASGVQRTGTFGGQTFVLNPIRPQDNRAFSSFDARHIVNANAIWILPFGRGKSFGKDIPKWADAFIGGWQVTGIFRYNSGFPINAPFDGSRWATNWNVQSNGVLIRPLSTSPTRGGSSPANLFSDPVAASQSYRNPRAGETGDRNTLRLPGFINMDLGLNKSFKMPWSENHQLQFRWETFNITNTQRLGGTPPGGVPVAGLVLGEDNQNVRPGPNFGNFTAIQGSPRVMQFALRYTF